MTGLPFLTSAPSVQSLVMGEGLLLNTSDEQRGGRASLQVSPVWEHHAQVSTVLLLTCMMDRLYFSGPPNNSFSPR